ncbi:MAG: hypothetical protein AAGK04_00535 [Planctomycetota bacterium]
MSIDPRELQSMRTSGAPVEAGRTCRRCGYELEGLSSNDRCPECGAPVTLGRSLEGRFADNLADAPPGFLRWMLLSVGFMALLALAMPFAQVFAALSASNGLGTTPIVMVYVCLASVWVVSVALVTREREKAEHTLRDSTLDSPRYRWVCRSLQVGAPLAALALVGVSQTGTSTAALVFALIAVAMTLAYSIGLGVLAYYLRAIADWAGESGLSQRYLAAAWGLSVFVTLELACKVFWEVFHTNTGLFGFLAGGAALVRVLSAGLVIIGHIVFLVCNLQLAWMIRWALEYHEEAEARDIRIAERKAQREAAHAGPALAGDIDPIDLLPTTSERPPAVRPLPTPKGSIPLAEPEGPASRP